MSFWCGLPVYIIKITLLVKNIFQESFILKIIVALLTVYLKYKNDTSMQQDFEI
jgi:hypothetical protein